MNKFFCLLALILISISCQNETCTNSNSIFDKNSPESKPYQDELIKQLKQKNNPNVTFNLNDYIEKNDTIRLYIATKSNNLCAIVVVKVLHQDDKLKGIIKNKGKGYIGAELKNLRFDIIQDSLKTELIYKDVERIID